MIYQCGWFKWPHMADISKFIQSHYKSMQFWVWLIKLCIQITMNGLFLFFCRKKIEELQLIKFSQNKMRAQYLVYEKICIHQIVFHKIERKKKWIKLLRGVLFLSNGKQMQVHSSSLFTVNTRTVWPNAVGKKRLKLQWKKKLATEKNIYRKFLFDRW